MTCKACEERNAYADGLCLDCRLEAVTAFDESSRIQWRRDWDAIALGFVVGCLVSWIVLR